MRKAKEITRLDGAVMWAVGYDLSKVFFQMEGVIMEEAKKLGLKTPGDTTKEDIREVIRKNFSDSHQKFYGALLNILKEQFDEQNLKSRGHITEILW